VSGSAVSTCLEAVNGWDVYPAKAATSASRWWKSLQTWQYDCNFAVNCEQRQSISRDDVICDVTLEYTIPTLTIFHFRLFRHALLGKQIIN
jgi:hypothetical protein